MELFDDVPLVMGAGAYFTPFQLLDRRFVDLLYISMLLTDTWWQLVCELLDLHALFMGVFCCTVGQRQGCSTCAWISKALVKIVRKPNFF